MTMIEKNKITCAVCGNESEHYVLLSTNTFGYCDLDLRPPQMKRDTMDMWVQECPVCRYVAGSLDQPIAINEEWLKSEEYVSCRMFASRLAKRFFRRYLLNLKENKGENAFYSVLHSAWVCDDVKDYKNAIYCRKLAIAELEKLIEKEPGNENYLVLKADLMRRSELFEEVISEYGNKKMNDNLLEKIRSFEVEKAKSKDNRRYTVEDAEKAQKYKHILTGAIIGDIVGSIYEFDNHKTEDPYDFELFTQECFFTDDTVMTIAVAEALMKVNPKDPEEDIRAALVSSMKKWGRQYPHAGYGGRFFGWLKSEDSEPYNSYGNGSAMRVSPAGWLYDDIFTTRYMARLTAAVTHNHPEGIKGAEATAAAIFLARKGEDKADIRDYIEAEFGYRIPSSCDEIRAAYTFNETCQKTVPQAFAAFLDGRDFEEVIRLGVSLGGDTDTLCAIAGSIAEAYFGVPEDIAETAGSYLPVDMLDVLDAFSQRTCEK